MFVIVHNHPKCECAYNKKVQLLLSTFFIVFLLVATS